MFQTYEAVFESHDVLRAQTLNEELNGAARTIEQLYSGYSDGVLRDIVIEPESNSILLKSGMVVFKGKIYHLENKVRIDVTPGTQRQFLKLRFEEVQYKNGIKRWTTDVILDENETTRNNEMELCRFCYQKGAKLRTTYNSFKDYGIMYDIVNIVYAPHAAFGESTVSPGITRSFGNEMMQSELTDPYDISFCFECQRDEAVSRKSIIHYIEHKMHIRNQEMSNYEIYTYLSKILNNKGVASRTKHPELHERRLIVD